MMIEGASERTGKASLAGGCFAHHCGDRVDPRDEGLPETKASLGTGQLDRQPA